jgi:FdhD protein
MQRISLAHPSIAAPATTFRFAGGPPLPIDRPVAVETAVNLVYGTVPFAVMMTTPDDLEDFAVGFSLTEGIIAARADIRHVGIEPADGGVRLLIDLAPDQFHSLLARRRSMAGRTGCGVCGIEDLADLPRATRRSVAAPRIRLGAIHRALDALAGHQRLNDATRAVHAAAWAGLDGDILCVREDVGRHNALDKLIGALLTRGAAPEDGFLLITSRCSFEMVEKAAAFGASTLVAISAPTSLGIERAQHHDITLAAIARHDAVTVFSRADRIVAEQEAFA